MADDLRLSWIDPDFRPRHKPGMQCYRCGKTIKDGSPFRVVHVTNDGCAIHPDHDAAFPEAGAHDWLPLGMDCARKVGLAYTHPPAMLTEEGRNA